MLAAGIPLVQAFEIVGNGHENAAMQKLILAIKADVEGGSALAEGLTVDEVVQRTEQVAYYQGDDGRARVTMTITDGQGRVRNRRFQILRRDQDGDADEGAAEQKYFVHIKYPADVKNTVFMVWKHPERDDDRWLYLPALDLVKRIAAGLEDQCCSFRRFRVSRGYSAFHHPIDRYHLPQTVREYNKTGSHAFSCGYKGLCKEGSSGSFPVISSERCYV